MALDGTHRKTERMRVPHISTRSQRSASNPKGGRGGERECANGVIFAPYLLIEGHSSVSTAMGPDGGKGLLSLCKIRVCRLPSTPRPRRAPRKSMAVMSSRKR